MRPIDQKDQSSTPNILNNTEHALDECEITNGEYQPQRKRVSGEHSIRKDETFPTENEIGAHLIEVRDFRGTEKKKDTQPFYHRYISST